jgi:UDP-N-acetylmuramate--alanine ligase
VRYGVGEGVDLRVKNLTQGESVQSFELIWKDTSIGIFHTPLPGLYNIYNILGAVATYLAYGGNSEYIQQTLTNFVGVGRRFELLGNYKNTMIISDYAHHPTALKAVVDAAHSRYKNKRILTVFRPHHRERTIKLMDDFVKTILGVPHMILVEIYDVTGREEDTQVSSRDVIAKVLSHDSTHDILYAKDLVEAEAMTRAEAEHFDVVLVVGAGDADQLAKKLVV